VLTAAKKKENKPPFPSFPIPYLLFPISYCEQIFHNTVSSVYALYSYT